MLFDQGMSTIEWSGPLLIELKGGRGRENSSARNVLHNESELIHSNRFRGIS